MDEQLFKHVLAVVGTVLYIVRAAPVTLEIVRGGRMGFDARLTLPLLLLAGVWWFAYSLEIDNWPSLVSAGLGLVAPAYGLAVLARTRDLQRGIIFLLVAGLVAIVFEVELTPRAVGVTAAVGTAGIAVPQTIRLLRNRAESAADTSLGTWALVAFNGVVWLVYGILVGHPLLGAPGLVAIPCSLTVIYRARHDRKVVDSATTAGGAVARR